MAHELIIMVLAQRSVPDDEVPSDDMKATPIGLYMCADGSPSAHAPPQCMRSKLGADNARIIYVYCLKRLMRMPTRASTPRASA